MHFTQEKVGHFAECLDSFTLYAAIRCGIVDSPAEMFDRFGAIDNDLRREAYGIIWEDPFLVGEYVEDNPFSLKPERLREVEAWKDALYGEFTLVEYDPQGRAMMLGPGGLCAVCGISHDIALNIPPEKLPCLLRTVLLPFDGKVTYGYILETFDVALGPGILKSVREEYEQEKAKGTCATDRQFAAYCARARKDREDRDREEMRRDFEFARKKAGGYVPEGYHRGCLCGLSEEERLDAIAAAPSPGLPDRALRDLVDMRCLHRKPRPTAAEQLGQLSKQEVLDIFLRAYPNVDDARGFTKAALAEFLVRDYAEHLADIIHYLDSNEIDSLRTVVEKGGRVEYPTAEFRSCSRISPCPPLLFGCRYEGKYTFFVPDELTEAVAALDWDAVARERAVDSDVEFGISNMAEMCGVVSLADAYRQFRKWYRHELSFDEYRERALRVAYYTFGFGVWSCADPGGEGTETYFIASALRVEFEQAARTLAGDGREAEESWRAIDAYILDILEGHKIKPIREFEQELSAVEAMDWVLAQPAYVALRNNLDEHVPDGENDYFYADGILEDVYCMSHNIELSSAIPDMLAERGAFCDPDLVQETLNLAMRAANSTPCWENNGRTAEEIHEMITGRKVFYGSDGAPKKVGRNDPCPCGSGKKYKKCCGSDR